MTFKTHTQNQEAYVWFFPPQKTEPAIVGRIFYKDNQYVFNYGRSWLESDNAISLYEPELPLRSGIIYPNPPLTMAGCLRDASPDAWGRRIIIHQLTNLKYKDAVDIEFDELTYMLHSGSDRIGALDFQESSSIYTPRQEQNASLEELQEASRRVATGDILSPELARALFHGSSIGGARPKAILDDKNRKMIAKFSMPTDSFSFIKAEFLAMRLAQKIGINVANVDITQVAGKDILLIERFDRYVICDNAWGRRSMVSALTLFGVDEMQARYTHYGDLADIIREKFNSPKKTLHELFSRMIFNILTGNTDDHARNHAAFWDGNTLSLTPAYDLCPQNRTGREATQAMLIHANDRRSRLTTCLLAVAKFQLTANEAREIIDHQIEIIQSFWEDTCDEARLSKAERHFLWKRQFLNDYAFEEYV